MALEDQLKEKTGLSLATVMDLLNKGWAYHEQTGKVPYWEHPAARIPDAKVYKRD